MPTAPNRTPEQIAQGLHELDQQAFNFANGVALGALAVGTVGLVTISSPALAAAAIVGGIAGVELAPELPGPSSKNSAPNQKNKRNLRDVLKAIHEHKLEESNLPKFKIGSPLQKKEAQTAATNDRTPEQIAQGLHELDKQAFNLANGVLVGALYVGTAGLVATSWPVLATAAIVGGITGVELAPELPDPASKKPAAKSGITHQPYFDPLKNQENGGATFVEDLDLRLSDESTRALLEKNFKKKPTSKNSPKQQAEHVMDTMRLNLKDYLERKSTTSYGISKTTFLDNLYTECDITDKELKESLTSHMDVIGKKLNAFEQFGNQYASQQARDVLFEKSIKEVGDVRYMQGEVRGAQKYIQALWMLGMYAQSPVAVKLAQVTLGFTKAASNVLDIIEAEALSNVAHAAGKAASVGIAASTGNYIALFTSIFSMAFSFFEQGPTIAEITLDYVQKAFKQVFDCFGEQHIRFDRLESKFSYVIEILNNIVEILKRQGHQIHDFQKSTEASLETQKVLIKEVHKLLALTYEESEFQNLHTTLRQVTDVIEDRNVQEEVISERVSALVGDAILTKSTSEYHTGRFALDPDLVDMPRSDTLIFSASTPSDRGYVTHPDRLKQATALTLFLNKMDGNSGSFFGFLAAYAKKLLADELKDVATLNDETKQVNALKDKAEIKRNTLAATLKKEEAITSRTPSAQESWEGDKLKHAESLREVIHYESRLGKLQSLRIIAALREEKQKQSESALSSRAQMLNGRKTAFLEELAVLEEKVAVMDAGMEPWMETYQATAPESLPPLPLNAKEWISTHQRIEALLLELIKIEQEESDLALTRSLEKTQGKPSFTAFNIPIAKIATEKYLEALASERVTAFYKDTGHRDIHALIKMNKDGLDLIELFQNNPTLFEDMWRSFANVFFYIRERYEELYQAHLAAIFKNDKEKGNDTREKEHHILDTVANPGRLRLDEEAFIQELLNPSTALGTEFQGNLLILQTHKKLFRHCTELVGAPATVLTIMDSLPDGDIKGESSIRSQLEDAIRLKKRAPFTQPSMYTKLSEAYEVFAKTLMQTSNPLPKPTATKMGSVIAAILDRLQSHLLNEKLRQYVDQIEESVFTNTFSVNLDAYFPDEVKVHEKPKSTRNKAFETLVNKAMEKANLHCIENARVTWAKSGKGKSAYITRQIGCELEYEDHPDGFRRRLNVKGCPKDVTPPEMGKNETSQTLWPAAYFDQKRGVWIVDYPGFEDNRERDIELLTMIMTQVGVKTTATITAIEIPISYYDFKHPKLKGLYDAFKVIATLFKEHTPIHAESIRILVTHIPEDADEPKNFFMKRLKALAVMINENLQKQENEADRALAYYLSFIIKEEKAQKVFLFDPTSDETSEAVEHSLEHSPAYPSADFALIGPETIKQEFISRLDETLIESQGVFDVLLTTPQKKIELEEKERGLITKIKSLTEALKEKADLSDEIKRIKNDITKKTEEIGTKETEQSELEKTQTKCWNELTALESRTELVAFKTFKYKEEERFPGFKEIEILYRCPCCGVCHSDHQDDDKSKIANDGKLECPRTQVVHEYTIEWSGDPFTSARIIEAIGACRLGGKPGDFILDEKYSNPSSGKYRGTYKGPRRCYGGVHIELMCPYNEQPEPKGELKNLRNTYANNQLSETLLATTIATLKKSKLALEADLAKALLATASNQVERESVAFQLKTKELKTAHTELSQTQQALKDLKTLDNQARDAFHQDRSLYHSIHQLNELLGLKSNLCETFRAQFVNTLALLNEAASLLKITPCHPEPLEVEVEVPHFYNAVPKATEAMCFIEENAHHQSLFGPTVAEASAITCLPRTQAISRSAGLPSYLEAYGGKIQNDPRTGVPVYPVHFFPVSRPAITAAVDTPYQPMRPLGQIKLYGAPHLCKSQDGSRTNIVSHRGIVPEDMMRPESIEAICERLPPTHWDAINGGAKQGLFRGVTNVVGAALCSKETSKDVKRFVQALVYDSCYFAWRFQTHYAGGKPVGDTLYQASEDTFWLVIIGLASSLVNKMGNQASQNGFSTAGRLVSFFSQAAPLVYTAFQQGVVDFEEETFNPEVLNDLLTYILAAGVVEIMVESVAKLMLAYIFKAGANAQKTENITKLTLK